MGDNSSEACADISGKNRGCRNENIGAGLAEGIQGRERHLPILAERILEEGVYGKVLKYNKSYIIFAA